MNYKLINVNTKEQHLCEKIIVDGFDYYVSDDLKVGDKVRLKSDINVGQVIDDINKDWRILWFKPIATNNSNTDIPKVVDEVEELAEKFIGCKYEDVEDSIDQIGYDSFKRGYNKSQETHPNSDEDVIEFSKWKDYNFYQHIEDNLYRTMQARPMYKVLENKSYTLIELLQLWREQKLKTIWYE